jgi:hypothetical protein
MPHSERQLVLLLEIEHDCIGADGCIAFADPNPAVAALEEYLNNPPTRRASKPQYQPDA